MTYNHNDDRRSAPPNKGIQATAKKTKFVFKSKQARRRRT
jgi:hypothetical protein